ncbi:MAG: DUF2309 domain-containing protein [Candidatus Nitronauta litoralis]|uniref:Probable inorganic carbon transporter subunit DabA n=1 Tax=Candidatus Nitronauta litoralis TaxID=2705533 RepID=A0A7T0BW77_9BACT|nr:MAG: DUF2309 domain-containing protein [Candidatus Nitronauta litoralis]
MLTIDDKETKTPTEAQQIELRSFVMLAGEPISHFWPMKTFIHHNPLHGLEHFHFEKAIKEAERFFGGRGFLPNEEYRNFVKQGRITVEALNEALKDVSKDATIELGNKNISHLEFLKTILLKGTGKIAADVASAVLQSSHNQPEIKDLIQKVRGFPKNNEHKESLQGYASREQEELATRYTLGEWCDQTFGTDVQRQINSEIIKWISGFLDEGHGPWGMPLREKSFYGSWKELAQDDGFGSSLGIPDWKNKIKNLPDRPEDAILEIMARLSIPKGLWINYFTLHFAQLAGWTGLIKWRSEQLDYEWQNAFPIDLVKYMAVRIFYERELVDLACRSRLAIPGSYTSIRAYLNKFSVGYGLFKDYQTRGLPEVIENNLDMSLFIQEPLRIEKLDQCNPELILKWEQIREQQEIDVRALIVLHLAKSINIPLKDILKSGPVPLVTLLDWVEEFPESKHGPVWLKALESSFITDFVKKFTPNIEKLKKIDASEEKPTESRPLSQSIFCIDVRSEGFRRHLEEVGGNETFGFAGFFGVPICYQEFSSEHQTDQCPVLLKPKHVVKEIPRAYQAKAAQDFLEGQQLAKAGHTLLHDLKENVITPYVMVEAIGWFFGFRLFGQTLRPNWFKSAVSWLKERLAIPIGTTLTVEKIERDEAHEMVASKHRASIYKLLIEQYGSLGATVSHEQVERLRKLAMNEIPIDSLDNKELNQLLQWGEPDLVRFIEVLRKEFDVNERDVDRQMQRITQAGFTVAEQAHYVETALRVLGFKTFSRLILLCAHGSTSDNNPYESALDCGACGGNHGVSNARALAVMANKPEVRHLLALKNLVIPEDTHFLPGQHDTTTDEVELYDLEDVPATHRKDLIRLQRDLHEAGEKNSRERLARMPDESDLNGKFSALKRTKTRSIDWSQVRPEWGLSGHTAFITGRRLLTQGLNLEARTFLHSYDYKRDPDGKYLEIIMTAPMVVGQWINMEHYFSTVDTEVFGAGSKAYHNVVGRVGVMFGTQSDLCVGLPIQTVFDGDKPYHEPMRLFVIIEAPREMITTIISRHNLLQKLTRNQWLHIVALDPEVMEFFLFKSPNIWEPIHSI